MQRDNERTLAAWSATGKRPGVKAPPAPLLGPDGRESPLYPLCPHGKPCQGCSRYYAQCKRCKPCRVLLAALRTDAELEKREGVERPSQPPSGSGQQPHEKKGP